MDHSAHQHESNERQDNRSKWALVGFVCRPGLLSVGVPQADSPESTSSSPAASNV
jgi:hypothetical protein